MSRNGMQPSRCLSPKSDPQVSSFSGSASLFFDRTNPQYEYACRSRGFFSPFKFKANLNLIFVRNHPLLSPLMLDQYNPIMLHPSNSHSSIGVIPPHMFDPYNEKVNPGHLYVRQPHAIQIIQLVEGPPPPRRISSATQSSSASFSSGSSYPSTSDSEEDDCSSYCSSYVTHPDPSQDREPVAWTDDTYHVRMKRIHDWRDNSIRAMSSSPGTFFVFPAICCIPDSNIYRISFIFIEKEAKSEPDG